MQAMVELPEPVASGDLSQLVQRAERLELAGKLSEAEQVYRQALRALPDHPSILHNLGLLLAGRGELAEAELLLRRAVAAAPSQADLHNSLGTVLQRRGGLPDAEACYRKALELQADYADARFNLGALLEELGRPAEALQEYRAALSLQPQFARAMTRIGSILHGQGEHEAAAAELDRAIKAGPHFFDAHYYRGSVLSALGRHDEALASMARATSLRPDSFEALMATANTLRDAGRDDQALAGYWRALESRPGFAGVHEAINVLAWSAGRRDLYLRSFEYARQKIGPNPDLLFLEASFRSRNEDYARAEDLLWRANTLAPLRGNVMGLLARAMAQQGRFEEAYAFFPRAIAAEPLVMLHRQEFGFALLRDAQVGEALEVFELAHTLSPYDQITLAGLALAYRASGDSRYEVLVDAARYVRSYDLRTPKGHADREAFNAALANELRARHTAKAEPVNQSLRGGTQTTGDLFASRNPLILQVREAIEEAIAHYVRELPDDLLHPAAMRKTAAFDFSGSWSCQLGSQGFHANHVHHKGWISSAYYVGLPSAVDDEEHRYGWLKFGESNLALGESDRPELFVKPKVGRLVLFPSFFWHGTVPFPDTGKRMSIAFDAIPRPAPVDGGSPAEIWTSV